MFHCWPRGSQVILPPAGASFEQALAWPNEEGSRWEGAHENTPSRRRMFWAVTAIQRLRANEEEDNVRE